MPGRLSSLSSQNNMHKGVRTHTHTHTYPNSLTHRHTHTHTYPNSLTHTHTNLFEEGFPGYTFNKDNSTNESVERYR